jgi:hypothetical protein
MKVMTVSLSPDPSPARGEGRFLSRIRDFHIKQPQLEKGIAVAMPFFHPASKLTIRASQWTSACETFP